MASCTIKRAVMLVGGLALRQLQGAMATPYSVYSATLTELSGSGVSGEVTVFVTSTGLMGAGKAMGLEASLADSENGGSDCTATNGCGVHVHSGTACTDSATQGGHYFDGSTDPWATVRYGGTDANGDASFSFAVMDNARSVAGKPFIVHNNAGGRVACGILQEVTTEVRTASLGQLSDSGVTGTVTVYTTPTMVVGAGMAQGLEADLADAANGGSSCTATNGCGVHVHSGHACTDTTTQGGHYFDGSTDPWATVRYGSTDANGDASFVFRVVNSATDVTGKPFIVHNNAGGRVACGLLVDATPYPVYSATLTELSGSGVSGEVTVFVTSTGLMGAGKAMGLEASLADSENGGSDCTATNGCGVHVHSGTACTDSATQGGHYFDGSTDPWATVRYGGTDANGDASFSFAVMDNARSVAGKPFIVHNNAGGRVACGILQEVTSGIDFALPTELSGSGVAASVTVRTTPTMIFGAGTAYGLETSLADAMYNGTDCTATNGCGAHIHSGTACTDTATQGGHYYIGATDPWATVGYGLTSATGVATFTFQVDNGETDVAGKPFIVHNNAGGRVSCGLLQAVAPPPESMNTTTTMTTTSADMVPIGAGPRSVAPLPSLLLVIAALFAYFQ